MTDPRDATVDAEAADLVPARFDPVAMHGELVEAEHLARYWWIGQLARGRRVLDAGCGLAYGTQMLADAGAAEAVGIDVAESVLEVARGRVGDAVELVTAPIDALPFPDDAFDLVVCFEVIEHLEEHGAALAELARVLAPGGTLAVSSPNPDQYPPGNPHHVRELTAAELAGALAERFRHVERYAQHDLVASSVLAPTGGGRGSGPLDAIDDLRLASAVDVEPGRELFTIALASERPLPPLAPRAVATSLVEVKRWLEVYDAQQAALERQRQALSRRAGTARELRELREQLASAERALATLPTLEVALRGAQADVARAGAEIEGEREERERLARELAAVREELAAMTAHRDRLHLRLEHSDAVMATLKRSPSWRLTAPLRRAKALLRRP